MLENSGRFRVVEDRMWNTVKYYLQPREVMDMRVPDAVLNCIVFLGKSEVEDGKEIPIWGGTGFLVELIRKPV